MDDDRLDGGGGVIVMTFISVTAGVAARERIATGEHLVEQHAEREDVAALVDRPAERLFGRQIPGNAVRIVGEAFG